MPIDPIKIPQNVYIEDRIIGPLTLKQVIIVAIGCGFSYGLYSILLKTYGDIPLPITIIAWIPGALSFAFAFLKINDVSLFRIMLLSAERTVKPPVRIWAPRRGLTINIKTFVNPEDEKKMKKAHELVEEKNTDQISELSSLLDLASPPKKVEEKEPASPMEEIIEDVAPVEETPTSTLAVNPARISASPMETSTDTVSAPPKEGSVSIFRDLAPRS